MGSVVQNPIVREKKEHNCSIHLKRKWILNITYNKAVFFTNHGPGFLLVVSTRQRFVEWVKGGQNKRCFKLEPPNSLYQYFNIWSSNHLTINIYQPYQCMIFHENHFNKLHPKLHCFLLLDSFMTPVPGSVSHHPRSFQQATGTAWEILLPGRVPTKHYTSEGTI